MFIQNVTAGTEIEKPMKWQVIFRIFRYKQDCSQPHFDTFHIEVKPDEYVLDAIERIWAEQDRTLTFRQACHHAACGACGMRVNGREKLTCITRIDAVLVDGGTLTVEPLRNLPVVSDLVVDMAPFFARMEQAQFVSIRSAEPMVDYATNQLAEVQIPASRFENCLECAICYSACPIPGTDPEFAGPAALAAAGRMIAEPRGDVDIGALWKLVDAEEGLWRCHTAFECVEACPANVDPSGVMMALRRQILVQKIKGLFGVRSG
jgi:succinate dehydrogenase / fumarate reductase iron-sulfur subunit